MFADDSDDVPREVLPSGVAQNTQKQVHNSATVNNVQKVDDVP